MAVNLPPGYTLDSAAPPSLPPGYTLDSPDQGQSPTAPYTGEHPGLATEEQVRNEPGLQDVSVQDAMAVQGVAGLGKLGAGLAARGVGAGLEAISPNILPSIQETANSQLLKSLGTGAKEIRGLMGDKGLVEGPQAVENAANVARKAGLDDLISTGRGRREDLANYIKQQGQNIGNLRQEAGQASPDLLDNVAASIKPKYNAVNPDVFSGEASDVPVAQNTVSNIANKLGPNTKSLYHGSNADFNSFDLGTGREGETVDKLGHFFAPTAEEAGSYGKNVNQFNVTLNNPFKTNIVDLTTAAQKGGPAALRTSLQKAGYDGIEVSGPQGEHWSSVAFDNSQIKPPGATNADIAKGITGLNKYAAGNRVNLPKNAFTDFAEKASAANDAEIAQSLGPDKASDYLDALNNESGAFHLQPAMARGFVRETVSRGGLNPITAIAQKAADLGGNRLASKGLNAVHGALTNTGPVDTIVNTIKNNPGALGKYAPALQQAFQDGGSQGVAATHYVLSLQHPDYNAMTQDQAQ